MWGPPVISWFYRSINYRYIYHKSIVLGVMFTNLAIFYRSINYNNQPKRSPRTGGLTYSICYELEVFRQHAPAIVKWRQPRPSTYMKNWGSWCHDLGFSGIFIHVLWVLGGSSYFGDSMRGAPRQDPWDTRWGAQVAPKLAAPTLEQKHGPPKKREKWWNMRI